jgi:phage baseplate assembly protein W
MASVIIDTLKKRNDYGKPTYIDIRLDLKQNYTLNPKLASKDTVRDIIASFDLDAVKNSLFNLFTTIPGQKILNPIYGLNLYQFLFTGVTDSNSRAMGTLILDGITKFEPRLQVKKIYILPDIENQTYFIGLRLDVPSLNTYGVELKGTLSESGYYFN